jgi:mRNA-degrading endonuclease RelE of RelBE toxin-antitoxin system
MFKVIVTKKVLKTVESLPSNVRKRLAELLKDLRDDGPLQVHWPNFSKLSTNQYHCHLARKWVVCWYHKKGALEIEVYYAGSRENSPY